MSRRRLARVHGFSLLEVLVAMFIISIGILGVVGLQMLSLQRNSGALNRTYASQLAYDILDRVRSNSAQDYTIALADDPPDATDCGINLCDPDDLAQYDLELWLNSVATRLPEGDAAIARAGNVYTVTLQWQDNRAGGPAASIEISAEITP